MKDIIHYPDFEKLDLRVGKIIAAQVPEWSEKLIEYQVDFGEEIGQKTIMSGIKQFYTPEDLIGKSFIFIANLAERKMGQGVSQGMMLMAVDEANVPTLVEVGAEVKPGTMVR
ncbi:MAG TPA: hypothetical protein VD999_07205 [Vitreimonas sp.]|nr:hypothetical protein [Vitreimonas sp.]